MEPIEIIVIIAAVLIVGGVLGSYIYKKITHKPTGDCSACSKRMKKNFDKISKELHCSCHKDK